MKLAVQLLSMPVKKEEERQQLQGSSGAAAILAVVKAVVWGRESVAQLPRSPCGATAVGWEC